MNFRYLYDIFRYLDCNCGIETEYIGTFETNLKQHDAFSLLDQCLATEKQGIYIRRRL